MCFLLVFFILLGFFPIGILYHCSSDPVNIFWDVLSLIAVVLAPGLQGRWVSSPAGGVLYPIWSAGKPYWKEPWAAAHPEFSLLVWCQCLLVSVEGNREKKNLVLGSFHCYRKDLATECTQAAPESGKMDVTIQIQALTWLWSVCRIKVRQASDCCSGKERCGFQEKPAKAADCQRCCCQCACRGTWDKTVSLLLWQPQKTIPSGGRNWWFPISKGSENESSTAWQKDSFLKAVLCRSRWLLPLLKFASCKWEGLNMS